MERRASYFNVGDVIYFGKYKNKKGIIRAFGADKWGNPTIEVEPVPKGRKKNKILGLFRVWRADIRDKIISQENKIAFLRRAYYMPCSNCGEKCAGSCGGSCSGHCGQGCSAVARIAAKFKKKIKTEAGNTVYTYSERQIANRNREKAERVEKLSKSMSELRKKIKRDINAEDDKKRYLALAVWLIDHTYERVGNDDSADERGHFGVTGWLKKHVTFKGDSCKIKYVGKSGVKHEKTIEDSALKKALKDACEAVDDDDPILSYKDGKIDASAVNEYLSEFDITAKDLRGYHANREMQSRLKRLRSEGGELPTDRKKKEKKLKDEFKKALEETAEAVGHEAATLRSQYLVPGLEDTYMKDGEVMKKLANNVFPACLYTTNFKNRVLKAFRDIVQSAELLFTTNNDQGAVIFRVYMPKALGESKDYPEFKDRVDLRAQLEVWPSYDNPGKFVLMLRAQALSYAFKPRMGNQEYSLQTIMAQDIADLISFEMISDKILWSMPQTEAEGAFRRRLYEDILLVLRVILRNG